MPPPPPGAYRSPPAPPVPLGLNELTGEARANEDHRLAAVIRRSPYLTTILSEEGLIDFQSSPSADLLGFDAENMVGVSFATLVSSQDASRWEQFFEKVATGTAREATAEWALRRSDGTFAHVESTVTNFLDDNSIAGIVVLSRPIGEVREYVPDRAVVPHLTAAADWQVDPDPVVVAAAHAESPVAGRGCDRARRSSMLSATARRYATL